jgi:hypothetical protein
MCEGPILRMLISLLFVSATANAQLGPLPEVERSSIEYESTAEALAALRSKPGVEMTVQGNWTIAYEPRRHVIWSFAPTEHPAYPAVVKRAIVEKDGSMVVEMAVKCQASKAACDDLVREFIRLNEAMRKSVQAGIGKEK